MPEKNNEVNIGKNRLFVYGEQQELQSKLQFEKEFLNAKFPPHI